MYNHELVDLFPAFCLLMYLSNASFSASFSANSFSSFTLKLVFMIPDVKANGSLINGFSFDNLLHYQYAIIVFFLESFSYFRESWYDRSLNRFVQFMPFWYFRIRN